MKIDAQQFTQFIFCLLAQPEQQDGERFDKFLKFLRGPKPVPLKIVAGPLAACSNE